MVTSDYSTQDIFDLFSDLENKILNKELAFNFQFNFLKY